MTLYGGLFYILAAFVLATTVAAITRREPVHAVVCLVGSFLGTALLFYLLGAPILAALEVIIYAGAIMVLFLFIVMTTRDRDRLQENEFMDQLFILVFAGGTVGFIIAVLLFFPESGSLPLMAATVSPRVFGRFVFSRYWIAVEIVSLLLFVALVGALYLSKGNDKTPDPAHLDKTHHPPGGIP